MRARTHGYAKQNLNDYKFYMYKVIINNIIIVNYILKNILYTFIIM